MKTQKFGKKLILSKQTVTNLDERQQEAVHGGIAISYTCTIAPTCGNKATCCGSDLICSC